MAMDRGQEAEQIAMDEARQAECVVTDRGQVRRASGYGEGISGQNRWLWTEDRTEHML